MKTKSVITTRSVSHSAAIRFICENLEDTDPKSARCKAIRKHIEACPDCMQQLESIKTTIQLYKRYPEQVLTRSIKQRLRKALNL